MGRKRKEIFSDSVVTSFPSHNECSLDCGEATDLHEGGKNAKADISKYYPTNSSYPTLKCKFFTVGIY